MSELYEARGTTPLGPRTNGWFDQYDTQVGVVGVLGGPAGIRAPAGGWPSAMPRPSRTRRCNRLLASSASTSPDSVWT